MTASNESERKRQIREFQRNAQRLLTEDDRDYLHDAMKDYQTYKSVEKLIESLRTILDTPHKLDLLSDIRNLIPAVQISRFDSLAPYHKMAHPLRPKGQTSPDRKTQSLNLRNGQVQQNGRVSPSGSPGSFKVISLARTSLEQVLGFSLQGGQEQGCNVYVSDVDSGSQADKQGLCIGDNIIEVNGIDFEHIALNSAVSLLSSLKKIKMVVNSLGKLPERSVTSSPRRNPWGEIDGGASPDGNDSTLNSSLSSDGQPGITLQPNSHLLNSDDERRLNLVVEPTPTGFIGFTLRGGAEYGLGIYVSGIDAGSLAEQSGFRVGDQILDVNGKNFESVKHKEAVDFIKSNKHIIVTLKAVGKLPEAKHYTSEISWIYPDGTIIKEGKESFTRSLSMPESPLSPMDLSSSSTQFPKTNNNITESPKPELRDCGMQTPDASPRVKMDMDTQTGDDIPVRDTQQDLERTQSSKSVATSCSTTSSGEDAEKRHSLHSSTHSFESSNSNLTATNMNYSRSGDHVNVSDSELIVKDDSKKKVKKSKSFLQKHGDKIKSKLSFRKKSRPKMETKGGGPSKQQLLLYVEERAKKILVVDEYNAIIDDIKQYLEDSDVESLVHKLLANLDKPEKAMLLRDIRTLITSYDLGRFDAMVSAREKDALEYYSVCVPGSPSILPITVEKPKRQLIAAIQDSRGGFQIRSKEELEELKSKREKDTESHEVAQRAWLGGNILDRQARIGTSDYYAIQSTTPDAMEMVPVRDIEHATMATPHNPGPMMLSIPDIHIDNDNHGDDIAMETMTSPNTLTVPDRVSVEYKDDDEDDDVQMDGQKSAFFAFPPSSSAQPTSPSEEGVLILLQKNRTSLGISISGGKGSKMQPEIRVEKIFPGGAAHDDGRLQSGDEIIVVDGSSMLDVTHAEAVDIIRRSYNDKSKAVMEVTVIPMK